MTTETLSAGPAGLVDQNKTTGTTLPAGTRATSDVGSGTTNQVQTSSGSTSSGGSSATQNMTPEALKTLQDLITQLGDHPAISDIAATLQLQAIGMKEPHTTPGFGFGNPLYPDAHTDEYGRPVKSEADYKAALARYNAAKMDIVSSGGIIKGGTSETQAQAANRAEVLKTLTQEHAKNVAEAVKANETNTTQNAAVFNTYQSNTAQALQDHLRSIALQGQELSANKTQQGAYSKDAAFNDASALTASYARKLAETIMPTILRAAEASGTSGSATTALLAQDASARTAEAAATTGLNAATAYGQVSNQLAAVNERLINGAPPIQTFNAPTPLNPTIANDNLSTLLDDMTKTGNTPTLDALLAALGISKGAITNTQQAQTQNTSGTQRTVGATTTNKNENITQAAPTPTPTPPTVPSNLIQMTPIVQPIDTSAPYQKITKTTPATEEYTSVPYEDPGYWSNWTPT